MLSLDFIHSNNKTEFINSLIFRLSKKNNIKETDSQEKHQFYKSKKDKQTLKSLDGKSSKI